MFFVRSLTTGEPVASVALQLFAEQRGLGEATIDLTGAATFAPGLLRGDGGKTATALWPGTAAGDFVFIDAARAASIFLTARRRPPAAGRNGRLHLHDRGVYRPGEMVHLMAGPQQLRLCRSKACR
jgi:uncharacterized protein YfaS (alpha-2-macroglobulin family)